MSKRDKSSSTMALLAVFCLAFMSGVLADGKRALLGSGNSKYGDLLGKWQGTCVQKFSSSYCTDDIITYPFYLEYKYDKYQNKYYVQYREDAVDITTDDTYSSPRNYHVDSYSGKGYVDFYSAGSNSYCVSAQYDDSTKATYRLKYKHEGDLDFLVLDGELNYDHSGVWGKCFDHSYKSLFCNSYTYSYRCYLAKTSYNYKW